jgi:membrane associated rhomboid family serine protease
VVRLPDNLQIRAATLGAVIGTMWFIHILDIILPGSATGYGIVPRTYAGLAGIPVAPLIHLNIQHLVANTIPLLILGGLVLLRGVGEFVYVVLMSTVIAGVGTWLFGAGDAHHVGASGVIFGLFGYLIVRTAYDRRVSSAIVMVVVAIAYGTAMFRSLIPASGISWSGHFFGLVGGFVAARLKRPLKTTREL